jgi:hypothetical protein
MMEKKLRTPDFRAGVMLLASNPIQEKQVFLIRTSVYQNIRTWPQNPFLEFIDQLLRARHGSLKSQKAKLICGVGGQPETVGSEKRQVKRRATQETEFRTYFPITMASTTTTHEYTVAKTAFVF